MTTAEQEQAAKYASEERLFDARNELLKVNKESLTLEEEKLLEKAEACEKYLKTITDEIDPSWVELGESKKNGRSHSTVYNLQFEPVKVDFMIESVVESSLIFFLTVALNEVDLYPSWMPNWSRPKFKVIRAETLERSGNTTQVFTVRTVSPLATVEFYVSATGVDDTPSNQSFILKIDPLEPGGANGLVPDPIDGVNRVTLGGGLTFRQCPPDRAEVAKKLKGTTEECVLVNLSVVYENRNNNLKPGFLIRKMSNFVLKIITGGLWQRLIGVAEEIRDGKRPEFSKVIEEKPSTYNWAKGCIEKIVDSQE